MEIDEESPPHPPGLDGRTTFQITFSNQNQPPRDKEFVIFGKNHAYVEHFHLGCGNYLEENEETKSIVTSDTPFRISIGGTIVVDIENQAVPLFSVVKFKEGKKIGNKQFAVVNNANNYKVYGFDVKSFDVTKDEFGIQSFQTKLTTCKDCTEQYTFRPLHIRSDAHLGAAYLRRLTLKKQDVTVAPQEINIFFDPCQNVIQKWSINDIQDKHELNLYTEQDREDKWLSIIYLHSNQGLEINTTKDVITYDNYTQRIDMGETLIKQGQNKSQVYLKSTRTDPLEALVVILYEIRQEDGNKVYLKQTLHVSKGFQQSHHLEGLEKLKHPPITEKTNKGPTSSLGKNYLKFPTHYESRLLHPKVLNALEAISTRSGLNESKLAQVAAEHHLTEEERVLLAVNITTLKKPMNKTSYVEKLLLLQSCELNKNHQNQFGCLTNSIGSLTGIPGTEMSRAFIDVDKATLVRLNIKAGNKVILESQTGRVTGTLETSGDKTSSFIIDEPPAKINQWSTLSIVKQDNLFLTLAYYSVCQLVKDNKHILEYLFPSKSPAHNSNPQPIEFLQQNLSTQQKKAVTTILNSEPTSPAILTGPAGCGKSLVLAEIGLQIARKHGKVLYISPTNTGATSLYAVIRALLELHFADEIRALKLSSPSVPIGEHCDQCYKDSIGNNHRYPPPAEIQSADIIFATPTVALRLGFLASNKPSFDCILVDEAAYLTEAECLCAIGPFVKENSALNPHIILAGDPLQLTYCSRSLAAKIGGLEIDLMSRLTELPAYKDNSEVSRLEENFRNDRLLVQVLNIMIYQNRILCMTGPTKGKIAAVHATGITDRPLNDRSSYNAIDAITCLQAAMKEKLCHPHKRTIILCLYKAQLALLLRLQSQKPPSDRIPIITTESIQGSQADSVFISPSLFGVYPHEIPRSEWSCNIKRLGMSLSRAKSTFTLVGNLLLLNKIPSYSFLINIADETNNLHCADHIKAILRHDRSASE